MDLLNFNQNFIIVYEDFGSIIIFNGSKIINELRFIKKFTHPKILYHIYCLKLEGIKKCIE